MSKSLRIPKRRRRENKTDYKARLQILQSGITRIVIRRTNKYIVMQAVESHESQDKVIKGVTSKDLISQGWDAKLAGSLKSIPAAYLTGLLMAQKLGKSKSDYIIDIGMARNHSGSRIFAGLKGLVDGGLNVHAGEEAFPPENRLNGKHIDNKEVQAMIKKLKEKLLK